LRRQKNVSNFYPVHLRITIDRVHRFYLIETPQKINVDQWSGKDNAWVKNTHPFAFDINNIIKEKIRIVTDLVKRYFNSKKSISFPIVFRELQKSNNLKNNSNRSQRAKFIDSKNFGLTVFSHKYFEFNASLNPYGGLKSTSKKGCNFAPSNKYR